MAAEQGYSGYFELFSRWVLISTWIPQLRLIQIIKPVWSSTLPEFGVDSLNFTGKQGVNNTLVTSEVPHDCFETMFTDELCTYIANMTNKFAENSMRGKTLKKHSRLKRWTPLMADIKIYSAIVLYQGILWKPTL